MNRPQPWSMIEAVVLLDALLKVKNGQIEKSDAIIMTSKTLREMAKKQGVAIDYTYRNISGITFQYLSMDSAYTGKNMGKPASKLFEQAVDMYHNDNDAYEKLLEKVDFILNKTAENKFFQWIENRCKSLTPDEFRKVFMDIEDFCLKRKIIKESLFMDIDYSTAKKVKEVIQSNYLFGILYKNREKYIEAISYYVEYVATSEACEPDIQSNEEHVDKPRFEECMEFVDENMSSNEERIRKALKEACDQKKYGIHVSILKAELSDIDEKEIIRILMNAKWAKFHAGKWCYIEEPNQEKRTIVHDSAVLKETVDTLIAENSADEEMKGKYPIVYRRLNDALRKLSVNGGYVTVQTLHEAIKKITTPQHIIRILTAVSWAEEKNWKYRFVLNSRRGEQIIEEAAVKKVDFYASENYAFSTPVKITYFGEETAGLHSWTELYVTVFGILREDYPHLLAPGMRISKFGTGRIEVATEQYKHVMVAPKLIPCTDLYLETNVSATGIVEKIKFLLELCNVDASELEIYYTKKNEENPKQIEDETVIRKEEKPVDDIGSFIDDLFEELEKKKKVKTVFDSRPYESVLEEKFRRGFRIGSGLDMKKFRRYYEEINGCEIVKTDEQITQIIKCCTIQHEEKLYLPKTMLSEELKNQLFEFIRDEFDAGKPMIYFEALFKEFSESFLDYYIYDEDMLREYINFYNEDKFYISKQYISKAANVKIDPVTEVKNYLIGTAVPVEGSEICEALSHIPSKKVMQILGTNSEFIHNGRSHYFYVESVNLTEQELKNIATIISENIFDREFISGNELYRIIKSRYSDIIEKNSLISEIGFRDTIKYHLGERFSFNGNVISKRGQWMSMSDVFANFAKSKPAFDVAELSKLADEMNAVIYFNDVYKNALRVSQNRFVSKDQACFKISETDLAIDRFCRGEYISIKQITEFGTLPDAGFPWNEFLLSHYIYEFSGKYRFITAGFNLNTCAGAIVKKRTGIEGLDELLTVVLAEGPVELKKEDALEFLAEQGYLARRSYSGIEQVLVQANAKRNMKGSD